MVGGIAILGMFVHEGGHGLTAVVLGSRVHSVAVMPGIQLYPAVELRPWSGAVAQIAYDALPDPWQAGLALVMGSGLTAIVSYGAIALLLIARPRGAVRFALLFLAFLFAWDGIAYSVFPMFGLAHWIWIGGRTPEPIVGAAVMGIEPTVCAAGLALHAAATNGLLLHHLVRGAANRRRRADLEGG